jgi:peptidoglycan/LPS O-acetylase OafA/YrhL
MSPKGSSLTRTRWPAIDGLRGLAILAVIGQHYKLHGNGALGVMLFFVISGHVITHSLFEEIKRSGHISFKNFYIRRVARLVPMVILTCFLTVIFYISTSVPYDTWYLGAVGMLTFTENLMFFFHIAMNTTRGFEYNWSLGFEEQFYLIWPSLVFYTFRKSIKPKFLLLVALNLVFGLSLIDQYLKRKFNFPIGRPNISYNYLNSLQYFSVILLGAIVAIFLKLFSPKYIQSMNRLRLIWLEFFSILVLSLLILNLIGSYFPIKFLRDYGMTTTAIYGAILIFLIVRREPRCLTWILTIRPLVQIGKMSFTLYMINWFWYMLLDKFLPDFIKRHGLTTHLAQAFTLFIIAWFTYKKFELPAQKRINQRQKF